MTSNPLTIAAETLTAEDWPENELFCVDGDGRYFDLRGYDEITFSNNMNRVGRSTLCLIACYARCWFLDKAEEESLNIRALYQWNEWTMADLFKLQEKRDRYLASAAKWARISKGVKT